MNTVEELIKRELVSLGADGLCNPVEQCGCGVEELAPCGNLNMHECEAAKHVRPKKDDQDYSEEFPDGYYKVIYMVEE